MVVAVRINQFIDEAASSPIRFDSEGCEKMNDADVSKQIEQMVRFIRQEAEEKANEISVSAEEVTSFSSFILFLLSITAFFIFLLFCVGTWNWIAIEFHSYFFHFLQEFNIEKLQLVEAEKKKIRQEYERKQKQVEIRKKM